MKAHSNFALLLQHHLMSADRSATWLAKQLHVNPSTVNRWLNGNSRPHRPEPIVDITSILHLNLSQKHELLQAAGFGYQEHLATDAHAPLRDVSQVGAQSTQKPQLTPFMVPAPPPQGILGRATLLEQLENLLQLKSDMVMDVPPIALQGMGGIGKTTLAIALGRSPIVQRVFRDGVLWVSVGPNPTLRILLEDLGKALGLDLIVERNEDACRERLRSVLYHKHALLIVDDVWEAEHGRSFTVAGPHCRTVFTTREPPVAHDLVTPRRTVRVDVLADHTALELLHNLAPEAVIGDRESAVRLCARLEFLPLALTLAGRLLANEAHMPTRMKRFLDELLEHRHARLQLLQSEGRLGVAEDQPISLQAILDMSVQRLSRTDQERFAMLAVFGAEPLSWKIGAAAHVWGCALEDAETTIANFIRRGLVTFSADRYWMHALLADYAAAMLELMSP